MVDIVHAPFVVPPIVADRERVDRQPIECVRLQTKLAPLPQLFADASPARQSPLQARLLVTYVAFLRSFTGQEVVISARFLPRR